MLNEQLMTDIIHLLKTCQFRKLVDDYFAEDFDWIIRGSSQLSGHYKDKEAFFTDVIGRLSIRVKSDEWRMHIIDTYVTDNTLIVEMRGEVPTIIDTQYNNEYCWIFKFNDKQKVKQLIAYYDSLLVDSTLQIAVD